MCAFHRSSHSSRFSSLFKKNYRLNQLFASFRLDVGKTALKKNELILWFGAGILTMLVIVLGTDSVGIPSGNIFGLGGISGFCFLIMSVVYFYSRQRAKNKFPWFTKHTQKQETSVLRTYDWNGLELSQKNKLLDTVLSNISQGVCMFDRYQRLVFCNCRYAEIYDIPESLTKPGTTLMQILKYRVSNNLYSGNDAEAYIQQRLDCVRSNAYSRMIQELPNGRTYTVSHQPIPEGGWLTTHDDITEIRRIETKIAHMALHDALTDLPNRALFLERIESALQGLETGLCLAIMVLDLDHFKTINDSLGHPIGDELLCRVAERLRSCVGQSDTVARLGGDEFAIVQVSARQPESAIELSKRICDHMVNPFFIEGHQVCANVSFGIAVAPRDGNQPDQLLKNADMALYKAKGDGRGVYRFFKPQMDEKMRVRRQTEMQLRTAIRNQDFELFYQPIFCARNKTICGVEALLRWHRTEQELVYPCEFLPLAEEIGLIVPIGQWVVQQACKDASAWPGDIKVAVNVSAAQFHSNSLVMTVVNAISEAGIHPQRLELEITETALLKNSETTLKMLHVLRDLGLSIAMDDFGTGYSSLNYLRSFPFDKIKIDGSFVRDLTVKEDAQAIVRVVAGLGKSLGIKTTAEGVENECQLKHVVAEGFNQVQGFLLDEPRSASDITEKYFAGGENLAIGA